MDSGAVTTVPAQAARLVASALTKLNGEMARCMNTEEDTEERSMATKAMSVALANGKRRVLEVDSEL